MRWVIGDIHGMLTPLRVLVETVRARDPSPLLLFVGDYVNRGPDSRGVVEFLLSLPPESAQFCRGNHDDILDLLLNGHSFASGRDPVPVYSWFIAHGLDRTLESYGIDHAMIESVARKPSPERLTELVEPVPQSHRAFFRNLKLALEFPDIFVLHAKWNTEESDVHPDLIAPIMQTSRIKHRVLWERFSDEEILRKKHWHRRGFFGHTPVMNYLVGEDDMPVIGNKMVLLDTGVALAVQGRLTAFCVESDEIVQTSHFGEIIP